MKRIIIYILALCMAFGLCGCRSRLTDEIQTPPEGTDMPQEEQKTDMPDDAEQGNGDAQPPEDTPTADDPEAERREYSDQADAEITPSAENTIIDDPGEKKPEQDISNVTARVDNSAGQTATETVPADNADKLGTDDSGKTADTSYQYYQTLLDDKLGSLFECERLYVYIESPEDHVTVLKGTKEYALAAGAGGYCVSSKLTADGLAVDDGWIARKEPGAIVKLTGDMSQASALRSEIISREGLSGTSAVSDGRVMVMSTRLFDSQAGSLAAQVWLAKMMYPSLMEGVDCAEAAAALAQESGADISGSMVYLG